MQSIIKTFHISLNLILIGLLISCNVELDDHNEIRLLVVSELCGDEVYQEGAGQRQNCDGDSFTIGGEITNLNGWLTIGSFGYEELKVNANGFFILPTKVMNGLSYNVSIREKPAGQICSITNSKGIVNGLDITNVNIHCETQGPPYTIEGYLKGVDFFGKYNNLVIDINGLDSITLYRNGSFYFPSKVDNGTNYEISIFAEPVSHTCTLSNGIGTLYNDNVTDIFISCTLNSYAIGGSIIGLNGTLDLVLYQRYLNQSEVITPTENGLFSFSIPVYDELSYEITVLTQPEGQQCEIDNALGNVSGEDILDVTIECEDL